MFWWYWYIVTISGITACSASRSSGNFWRDGKQPVRETSSLQIKNFYSEYIYILKRCSSLLKMLQTVICMICLPGGTQQEHPFLHFPGIIWSPRKQFCMQVPPSEWQDRSCLHSVKRNIINKCIKYWILLGEQAVHVYEYACSVLSKFPAFIYLQW